MDMYMWIRNEHVYVDYEWSCICGLGMDMYMWIRNGHVYVD
jgi:hypothetical protein